MSRRLLPVFDPAASALPSLQSRWIDHLLGPAAAPRETEATCDDCAMLGAPGTEARGLRFSRETRCCTFRPSLANFLVGGALVHLPRQSHGARSLRDRLADPSECTPLGLVADPVANVAATAPERFGRDPHARCPHYEPHSGHCGLWQYREATCATWFCKHTRGALSHAYWNRLQQLLARTERAVAVHCALELGIPAASLAALHPLDRSHGSERADVTTATLPFERWGRWVDNVEGYFRACFDRAESLSPTEALRLGGAEVSALGEVVKLARHTLEDESLPARVMLGRAQVVGLSGESVRVQGYSHLDPLEVPTVLWAQLHHFDGRPVADALRAASEAAGQEVPAGAIRMLMDFGVLRVVG